MAAIVALVSAFAVAAALDWMWELTVVGMIGVLALGLLAGPAALSAGGDSSRPRRRYFGARAAFALFGLLILGAQAIPLLSQTELKNSREAAVRGEPRTALDDARQARSWQPWAASPHFQLALVHEEAGHLAAARTEIRRAIERDSSDWRLWLVLARIDAADGKPTQARSEFRRTLQLNPRSSLLASLTPGILGPQTVARK